jgi:hypothetical protein
MTDRVLAVVQNWRRPFNIRQVVESLRAQTVPLHIALVDCADDPRFSVDQGTTRLCDDIFEAKRNNGPACRFIPPLMLPQFKHCYFAVDDHLPGPRHVECLLQTASRLEGEFATIGQDGRVVRGGQIVKRRMKCWPDRPRPCDFITSSELIETRWIPSVVRWRRMVFEEFGDESLLFEDDLTLCMAFQQEVRARLGIEPVPCYLTPAVSSEEEWWAVRRLQSPHALSARPDHVERRNRYVQKAIAAGWSSQVALAEQIEEVE